MADIRDAMAHKELEALFKSVLSDLEKLKDAVDSAKTLTDELRADHATFKTVVDDIKTAANGVISGLSGDYLDSSAALAIGSTKPNVANGAFQFHINGVEYNKAADTAGVALSGDEVPQSKFGAWALDIAANGIITIVPATDNATGYDSAVLAAAGLPAVAVDKVRMGYCTATNSAAAFAPGTTDLDNENVTDAYTNATPFSGVLPSPVATSTPAAITAPAQTAVGTLTTTD